MSSGSVAHSYTAHVKTRPDSTPTRAWTDTRDTLRRINYIAILLLLPPVFLWNALRLDIPAERLLLVLSALGPLSGLVMYVLRGRRPSPPAEPVIDAIIIATAVLTVLIHWRFDRPELASGAILPALLAPGYFMRWNLVYLDQPRRRFVLSVTYLCLTVAAIAAAYVHGHPDLDPLTILLIGGLQLFHFNDFHRIARQIDLERDGRDAAEHTARHDPLTGLLNRRAFDTDAAALDPVRRHSLVLLDIDHFKAVNDSHGHDVGDQVLAALALRLQGIITFHGHAYRWGGEEFAVLLTDTPAVQAAEIAETIRRRIAEQPMAGLPVTVSLGTGEWQPQLTPRENFVLVDTALTLAKRDGRNRVYHASRPPLPTHLH